MQRHYHIPLSAIVLVIAASACFTTVDVTVKYLSQRYPVPLLVWGRFGVQLLILTAVMGPKLRFGLLRTSRLKLQLLRGTVLIASSVCFFSALKYLPLAEATALNYSSPILVTLMAGWFLRERLTRPRWAFVIGGFLGMLFIVRPGSEMLAPAALFAMGAAAFYATFQILTKRLAGEDLMVLLFYPSLVSTVLISLVVPFYHYDIWFPTRDLLLFLGIGLAGTLGHLMFVQAFQLTTASAIAPFTYMQLVWSTIAGWLVFGTFPDRWALVGMFVIAGSGLVLTWYERWRAALPLSEPAAVD